MRGPPTTRNHPPVCGLSVESPEAPRPSFNAAEYRFRSEMCRAALAIRPGLHPRGADEPDFERHRDARSVEPGGSTP